MFYAWSCQNRRHALPLFQWTYLISMLPRTKLIPTLPKIYQTPCPSENMLSDIYSTYMSKTNIINPRLMQYFWSNENDERVYKLVLSKATCQEMFCCSFANLQKKKTKTKTNLSHLSVIKCFFKWSKFWQMRIQNNKHVSGLDIIIL